MSLPDYIKLLSPTDLDNTLSQLETSVRLIEEAGQAKELAYGNKVDLLKRKSKIEADIDVTEAMALMEIKGEGKDAHAVVGGEKIYITNDKTRDAYRKLASKDQRIELAQVQGELSALDAGYMKANDSWLAAIEASKSVQHKAALQSSILNYLTGAAK